MSYTVQGALAAIAEGPLFYAEGSDIKLMTRGEAVSRIVEAFRLSEKQKDFILDCLRHPDECFFVFSAMSDYDDIRFYPLILYPDVFPAYRFYSAINTASILGLVHGYLEEDTSPFHPETNMTRIQALKVVLGASDLLSWKEKFEVAKEMPAAGGPESELPYEDVYTEEPEMWWYPRYLRFALDADIIDADRNFRPDEPVTETELIDMMVRSHDYQQTAD